MNRDFKTPGQSLVSFGKCKDLTYEECRVREPEYCAWILENPHRLNEAGRGLANYLQTKVLEPPSETPIHEKVFATECRSEDGQVADSKSALLSFGRYKGRTFQDIFELDPDYCSWVVRREGISNDAPDGLRAFATFLRNASMQPTSEERVNASKSLSPQASETSLSSAVRENAQLSRNAWTSQVNGGSKSGGGACVASGEMRVLFGKYRDLTFAEVCAMDPQYCDWVIKVKMYEPIQAGKSNVNMWMFVAYIQHRRLHGG